MYEQSQWRKFFDFHVFIENPIHPEYHYRWRMFSSYGKFVHVFNTKYTINYPHCMYQFKGAHDLK
jgi:hypothetical protein